MPQTASQPKTLCIDFEAFYDKDYSLKKMSQWNYVHDKQFDAYLVAAYGDGEFRSVSHPKDFNWSVCNGATITAHNASFDKLVFTRLQELGVIPKSIKPKRWVCTADLAVYSNAARNLKDASKYLLDEEVSKEVRDKMKGKTYEDAKAAGMEADLLEYGNADARLSYELWKKYGQAWPESEQNISELNREAGYHGVAIDQQRLKAGLDTLSTALFEAGRLLPWVDEGAKPLSPNAIRLQGRKEGIPVPASLAKTTPAVIAWEKEYGAKHPWIMAARNWRGINTLKKKLLNIQASLRADGTVPYQIKYFGANTGRFSGGGDNGGKFNMQNMTRQEMYGVELRPIFRARPGHKLVILDYAQIEARLLLWRAGDYEFLKALKEIGNIYKAYAKRADGIDIEKGTDDYQLYKSAVLGLGYMCSAKRYRSMLAAPPYNIEISEPRSEEYVAKYRTTNPKICKYWQDHTLYLRHSIRAGDATHEVELPSKRLLTYCEPQGSGRHMKAKFFLGGPLRKLHAGTLTNNDIQGTARDILCDGWRATSKAGYSVLWSVHDELIVEVPEKTAEDDAKDIARLMTTSTPWLDDVCPLEVEYKIVDAYGK